MVHAALLLLMLEAATTDLVFTISLKRSTPNLQLSTSSPADYPIFRGRPDLRQTRRNRRSWTRSRPSRRASLATQQAPDLIDGDPLSCPGILARGCQCNSIE